MNLDVISPIMSKYYHMTVTPTNDNVQNSGIGKIPFGVCRCTYVAAWKCRLSPLLRQYHRKHNHYPYKRMFPKLLFFVLLLHRSYGWITVLRTEIIRQSRLSSSIAVVQQTKEARCLLYMTAIDEDNIDDESDDGWGTPLSLEDKTIELRKLQEERRGVSANLESLDQQRTNESERDLFIPVFSLVAIAGLFGSYGYEMLRLYSRGELYLPWDN